MHQESLENLIHAIIRGRLHIQQIFNLELVFFGFLRFFAFPFAGFNWFDGILVKNLNGSGCIGRVIRQFLAPQDLTEAMIINILNGFGFCRSSARKSTTKTQKVPQKTEKYRKEMQTKDFSKFQIWDIFLCGRNPHPHKQTV